MENIYFIIISSALLLGFMILKEISRKNRSNLYLRLIASSFAIIALFIITVPINYQRNIDPRKADSAVLLTEAYENDSLAALSGLPLFSTDRGLTLKNKKVTFIPDLAYFLNSNPEFTKFHILGYGLAEWELASLSKKDLVFHPSVLPDGISSVSWQAKITSGEELLVQGSYTNSSGKDLMLILNGLGTDLDSLIIKKGTVPVFQLNCVPKHLDKAVYTLTAIADKDTISLEKIPVLVEEQEALRILILASSPDFENKFLKNWLYAENQILSSRTAISKDKFSMEFLNSRRIDLGRISPALLENFDILIGDMAELSRLNPAENQAVMNQVNAGMGLIIKADHADHSSGFYRRSFKLRENRQADQKTSSLSWQGHLAKKEVLPGSAAIEIMPQPGTQALVKNERGNILVSSRLSGKGRIMLSTIADSYTWMLGNNNRDYTSYWSFILEKAARKKEVPESWSLNTLPLVNTALRMEVETEQDILPSVLANGSRITFSQDPVLDFRWSGIFWPSESGWQSFRSVNSDTNWFYVSDNSAWKAIRAGEKLKNTRKFIEHAASDVTANTGLAQTYTDSVPPVWFYILFLLCCTYLWLEAKMF